MDHLSLTPNVLLTHIGEVFLESPCDVIPLASSSRHLFRILQSYRYSTTIDSPTHYYLHPHPPTSTLHVFTQNPYVSHSHSLTLTSCASTWTFELDEVDKTTWKSLVTSGIIRIETELTSEAQAQAEKADVASSATPVSSSSSSSSSSYHIGKAQPRVVSLNHPRHPAVVGGRMRSVHPIDLNWLPKECEHLIVNGFKLPLSASMSHLTKLRTIEYYDADWEHELSRIASLWPPHLDTMKMHSNSSEYNEEINPASIINLPSTLTSITLGRNIFSNDSYEDQPNLIQWPHELRTLIYIGHQHPVIGWNLPDSITVLSLGNEFNHPVDGWIVPRSLRELHFHDEFNQSLSGIVWPTQQQQQQQQQQQLLQSNQSPPQGLIELEMSYDYDQPLINEKLPVSLRRLRLYGEHQVNEFILPSSLEELTFSGEWIGNLKLLTLPLTLTRLILNFNFNRSLQGLILPQSLIYLSLEHEWNHPVENGHLVLNEGLKYLKFGHKFNQHVAAFYLPLTLESIEFGESFNHEISAVHFPPSLRSLSFTSNGKFNRTLIGCQLPSSLTRIVLGQSWSHTLINVILPSSLREFVLPSSYPHLTQLMSLQLPPSLQLLSIPNPVMAPIPEGKTAASKAAASQLLAQYAAYVKSLPPTIIINP